MQSRPEFHNALGNSAVGKSGVTSGILFSIREVSVDQSPNIFEHLYMARADLW